MKNILLSSVIGLLSIATIYAQNLNQSILDSIVSECDRTNTNALLIYKGKKQVYENYFHKPIQKIDAMSATKSVVSIAVLLLLENAYIDSLEQPVYTIYPEWNQGNKKKITIQHLLEHTSGLQNVSNAGIEVEPALNVVQLALSAELDDLPGSKFSYNNKACNLLAGIIEQTTNMKLDEFLDKHLFAPMGIRDYNWRKDSSGNPYAMAGLEILPADFAKIGLLLLNNGKWNGRQIISEKGIQTMIESSEKNKKYGMQWWLDFEYENYVIDDEFIASVRMKTDETTGKLLEKMKGTYANMNQMFEKAKNIFSPEELRAVGKLLGSLSKNDWKIIPEGKLISFSAIGYLGQYLIIVPEKEIVLVRMIAAENYKPNAKNASLINLPKLAKKL
ncbi:MAG TPA: serine hydrolase [Flavobacteriaceae bacterium]|nr:serine hydrolase [Flavobacteriaceae bacterium]